MNPYDILGVPRNANDQTIRRAYLEGIKQATPETNPERFKLLCGAYEKIRDEERRYKYELLNQESPGNSPLDVLIQYARSCGTPKPMTAEAMKDFLRLCSKT